MKNDLLIAPLTLLNSLARLKVLVLIAVLSLNLFVGKGSSKTLSFIFKILY